MDLVEAIDAWIDECIDDLSDDELERILVILDEVSASEFVDLETTQIFEEDIDQLVNIVGGDDDQRSYTAELLSAVFFGDEETSSDELPDDDRDDRGQAGNDVTNDGADPEELVDEDTSDRSGSDDVTAAAVAEVAEVAVAEEVVVEEGVVEEGVVEEGVVEEGWAEGALDTSLDTASAGEATTPDDTDSNESVEGAEPDEDGPAPTPAANESDADADHDDATLDESASADAVPEDEASAVETEVLATDDDAVGTDEDLDEDAAVDTTVEDSKPDADESDAEDAVDETHDTTEDLDDSTLDESDESDEDTADGEDTTDEIHSTDEDLDEIDIDDSTLDESDEDTADDEDAVDAETDESTTNDSEAEANDDELDEELVSLLTAEDEGTAEFARVEFATTRVMDRVVSSTPQVELREGDHLGPSFLTDTIAVPEPQASPLKRSIMSAVMVLGLAAFVFGMLQLVSSLDEEEPIEVAAPVAVSTPTPSPSDDAESAAETEPTTAVAADPSAPDPTPAPAPPLPPRTIIRLVNGDVMLASHEQIGMPPTFTMLYEAGDDQPPARDITWLNDLVGVVSENGDVFVVEPDARRPRPTLVYEAGDELDPVIEAVSLQKRIGVRTDSGDILLLPSTEPADPEDFELVWDAEQEEAEATDITSISDLLPFVLDTGDAQMVISSADNAVVTIWLSADQPKSFNVTGAPEGVLLGVGQGAVARYRLGEYEGPRYQSVWDPFTTEESPAIGYAAAGNRTAIVLGDGGIVLADDTGTGPRIWDPAETEIRAFLAQGDATQIVVLLETGSVVRIPLTPDELIESMWDVTDETLSPATQIAVEPSRG